MNVKIVAAFIVMMVTAACSRQPRMSAADLERYRVILPGMTEDCAERIASSGIEAKPRHTEQCFQMLAKQRWRGLWRNDFEGSIFCPAPAQTCSEGRGNDIWLSSKSLKGDTGALYAIEFIGRRTKVKGHYGHMGMFAHEVIVEQPISIKRITPAPLPLTKAENMAEWRRCEVAHTCIASAERRSMSGSNQDAKPRN